MPCHHILHVKDHALETPGFRYYLQHAVHHTLYDYLLYTTDFFYTMITILSFSILYATET